MKNTSGTDILKRNNSVDADKTGSYVLIADQIQKSNAGWKQWKNIYLEYEWQFFYRADYEMSDRQENIITSCTRQQRIKKIIHMIQNL